MNEEELTSELNRQGRLTVVDQCEIDEPKTKTMIAALDKLGLGARPMIVTETGSESLYLAARNIPNVDVLPNAGLNVYDLLRYHHLVVTRAALERIDASLLSLLIYTFPAIVATKHNKIVREFASRLSQNGKTLLKPGLLNTDSWMRILINSMNQK